MAIDMDQTAPSSTPADGQEPAPLKFETALTELERIAQAMEGGKLSLEESLEAYRRGTELLQFCQRQLQVAEEKIQVLENGSLRDFRPTESH